MAKKQPEDPTVRHLKGAAPEYPEGTHPLVPPSEQTWGPGRFSYSDLEESLKPDESTVAQSVEDPLEDEVEKARAEGSEALIDPNRQRD